MQKDICRQKTNNLNPEVGGKGGGGWAYSNAQKVHPQPQYFTIIYVVCNNNNSNNNDNNPSDNNDDSDYYFREIHHIKQRAESLDKNGPSTLQKL